MLFSQSELQKKVQQRRTFAIISHPDAGKTTLTEKLLLYGGAIHLAGAVRAKSHQKHTTSDWMDIEKKRGISVSSSALQFQYQGIHLNLLDTPGHQDFSEDTYRTLTAADAAIMLIDAAKGIEAQTLKLFEVCRMRSLPIFTFINKMDRPSKDPLDLMDELEKVLGIQSCPMNWPIGSGDQFRGIYDLLSHEVLLFQTQEHSHIKERLQPKKVTGISDPLFLELFGQGDLERGAILHQQFQNELELIEHAGEHFDAQKVLAGQLTPIFFGSAMNNFGIERFLERFLQIAPPPQPRQTHQGRCVNPLSDQFSGFIFKIQANMDPAHRDRVAFLRVCSGHFVRHLVVQHSRLQKKIKLSQPVYFFAQERYILEEAWPGDIIGLIDTTGDLRIGDTLCQGEIFEFEAVPQFSPEFFCNVYILDPMKRKQLKKGLEQLSEEGVMQIYRQRGLGDKDPILGVVGALQFEVLEHRLKNEYQVTIQLQRLPYIHARWIKGLNFNPELFEKREDSRCLEDRDQLPVILFKSDWALRWAEENYPKLKFLKTSPYHLKSDQRK